jgi:hypothetical protein
VALWSAAAPGAGSGSATTIRIQRGIKPSSARGRRSEPGGRGSRASVSDVDVILGSLVGVVLGFGLGWVRDWWNSRPRIDVRVGLVRTVYAVFVAMMMKYAWMQRDETSQEPNTAVLLLLNIAVLNESSDDAMSTAELIVSGAKVAEHPTSMPASAPRIEGNVLYAPAMIANERRFLGQNLPAHSLTEVRLVFEIYRRDLTAPAWSTLLDSKPALSITTIRGARAKINVDLRRTEAIKQPPPPKDAPTPPIYFTPPIKGYERFQERYEAFGTSYEETYFGKRFIYPDAELW